MPAGTWIYALFCFVFVMKICCLSGKSIFDKRNHLEEIKNNKLNIGPHQLRSKWLTKALSLLLTNLRQNTYQLDILRVKKYNHNNLKHQTDILISTHETPACVNFWCFPVSLKGRLLLHHYQCRAFDKEKTQRASSEEPLLAHHEQPLSSTTKFFL